MKRKFPVIMTLVGCSVGTNQGQSCVAMSRILAPAWRYEEIADRFAGADLRAQGG